MLTDLAEWGSLKGSGFDELLMELVSEDKKTQQIAAEALDYRLLSQGADWDENFGDPTILLNNSLYLDVIRILIKIVGTDLFNSLSKILTLRLLFDIFNFSSQDEAKQYDLQKAEAIRSAIISSTAVYQKLFTHENQDIQKRAQALLKIIEDT